MVNVLFEKVSCKNSRTFRRTFWIFQHLGFIFFDSLFLFGEHLFNNFVEILSRKYVRFNVQIVNIFAHEKGRSPERPNPRKYLVLLHFSPILVRHLSDFSPALVGDKTGMRVTVLHRLKNSHRSSTSSSHWLISLSNQN